MDDLKVYAGKPNDGKEYHLILDDIIFFSMEPDLPPETEPFPNRVIFLAAFDTGEKEKYWPGDFELINGTFPDSYWKVAKAVTLNEKSKVVRLEIKPERPLGAHTKLRFRYYTADSSLVKVRLYTKEHVASFEMKAKDFKKPEYKPELEKKAGKPAQSTFYTALVQNPVQGTWVFTYLDFTENGARNDGKKVKLKPLDTVTKIEFIALPAQGKTPELHIDEVVLFDAGE
jgi:hypothetical protein